MATLYDINAGIEDIINHRLVDPETGEINDDALAELDALKMDKEEKVDNIACLIKSLDAEAKAIREEAKSQIESRAIPREKKIERLKAYLTDNCDGQTWETARSKVSFRPSKRVILSEEWERLLPDKYIKCKTESKPDKVGLKKALDSGEEISGAALEEYSNIQIK